MATYTDPKKEQHWLQYQGNFAPGIWNDPRMASIASGKRSMFEGAFNKGTLDTQVGGLIPAGLDAPGTNPFKTLEESERRDVSRRFSRFGQDLQADIHGRNMGRSGFAGEQMASLGADEASAFTEVQANAAGRLQQYQQAQEELRAQAAQRQAEWNAMQSAAKKRKKRNWMGAALGGIGLIAAPFTGGASLGLAAQGANMYMSQ